MLSISSLLFVLTLSLQADVAKLKIKTLPLDGLEFKLPTSISLRTKLAQLQKPEFIAHGEAVGLNLSMTDDFRTREEGWVTLYRASDGTIFLTDRSNMALWIRVEDQWKCLLSGLRIHKTFGGAPPHAPMKYLGKGFFAFSESVPGNVEERKDDLIPQALAVTFLLDTNKSDLVERSKSFIYDHNPPVKVPDHWIKKYQLPQIASTK